MTTFDARKYANYLAEIEIGLSHMEVIIARMRARHTTIIPVRREENGVTITYATYAEVIPQPPPLPSQVGFGVYARAAKTELRNVEASDADGNVIPVEEILAHLEQWA